MIAFYGRTQPLAHYPIHECLRLIARLGFDGAEICLENEDIRPELLDDDAVKHLEEAIQTAGLASFSISFHKDYIYNDAFLAGTRRAIEVTRALGSGVCVFGDTTKRSGDIEEWRRMVARTRELVAVAEGEGVIIAKEFEPGFIVGCSADLLRLFAEIPSDKLAANLDLGHVFLCDPDPLQAIRQVGSKMVHGHIENMRAGVHEHLLPHEGDMDLRQYLAALDEIGFEGGLALDLYKHDYETVAPQALAFLRGLLAQE